MTAQSWRPRPYSLKVVAVVHNDSAYGAIEHPKRDQGGRYHDIDLTNPDFLASPTPTAFRAHRAYNRRKN